MNTSAGLLLMHIGDKNLHTHITQIHVVYCIVHNLMQKITIDNNKDVLLPVTGHDDDDYNYCNGN